METIHDLCTNQTKDDYQQLCEQYQIQFIQSNGTQTLCNKILKQHYQISNEDAKLYSKGYSVQLMTLKHPHQHLSHRQSRNIENRFKQIQSSFVSSSSLPSTNLNSIRIPIVKSEFIQTSTNCSDCSLIYICDLRDEKPEIWSQSKQTKHLSLK
jgi:hypothetical protein